MRRAEKERLYILVGKVHIAHIVVNFGTAAFQMVEGMVAYAVSAVDNLLIDVGIALYILAHAKKRSLCTKFGP